MSVEALTRAEHVEGAPPVATTVDDGAFDLREALAAELLDGLPADALERLAARRAFGLGLARGNGSWRWLLHEGAP